MTTTLDTVARSGKSASLLWLRGIVKRFAGVQALRGVDFEVRTGEVHALLGENGAGKSTLIKIIAGAEQPDEGEICIDGRAITIHTTRDAFDLGVATVYQEPQIFPELSVTENIFVGRELRHPRGDVDLASERRRVREQLGSLELDAELADRRMADLSLAEQQLVLIAKALSHDARLVIYDEPSAILTQRETDTLFTAIRELKARGVATVYISHRLEEVFEIADRVTILKDGELVATRPSGELSVGEAVQMMAGRKLEATEAREAPAHADVALRVAGLTRRGHFEDVSFEVRQGEIVGLFGLIGSGATEVAHAIFGIEPAESGTIELEGRAVRVRKPADALDRGIALLPKDRKTEGLFLPLPIEFNVGAGNYRQLARLHGLISRASERAATVPLMSSLGIKAPGPDTRVGALSGGNQQKVLLARLLAGKPKLVILDEPTRGVAVDAKNEIHRLIFALAGQGTAVIVISSELPEMLKLSDRLLVVRGGRLQAGYSRAEVDADALLRDAAGSQATGEDNAARPDANPRPATAGPLQAQAGRSGTIGTTGVAPSMAAADWLRRILELREATILAMVIILGVALSLAYPQFRSSANLDSILQAVSQIAIVGVGVTMVIIIGGIDVSVGSTLAVVSVVVGLSLKGGLDAPVAILIALAAGAAVGLLNGLLVGVGRVHSIVVTFGTMNLVRMLGFQLQHGQWVTGIPGRLSYFFNGKLLGLPFCWWMAMALTAATQYYLSRRPTGRHLYALGGNAETARLAGVAVLRRTVFVFAITGALVGLAAIVNVGGASALQTNIGIGFELSVIAAVVIGGTSILGGKGSVIGTLLAALLVGMITDAVVIINVSAYWTQVVEGLLIVITVAIDVLRRRARES